MRILIVSATSLEIAPLVSAFRPLGNAGTVVPRVQLYAHRGHDIAVLTTGVGMVATASWCSDALTRERYDVALNLGTCGSFHASLTPGTVVHVIADRLAELGAEDHDRFIPIEKLMLLDGNEFPFSGGQLVNVAPPSNPALKALTEVRGISVNTVHGSEQSIADAIARWHADVESMEGAAFMYACLTHDTAFAQVRAVSNLVEPRDRSRWSMAEAIACGAPSLMQGSALEDIAVGIDCHVVRQPLGVCAAIAPFNFPAMVPMWFLPFAIVTGNTFVLKPSEQVPLSQRRMMEFLQQADLPPGVVNLVNGGSEVVNAICDHPGIRAVSFVGSTPVARHVYQRATQAGKRVQALGGAKNFVVVMPDANLERSMGVISESFYGCAGERCLAGSMLVPIGDVHEEARDRMVEAAKALKVGDGTLPGVTMGPVISAKHRERVLGYIEKGVAAGAKLLVDGRQARVSDRPNGFFVGPTLFDEVSPKMAIGHEEIFGPVASVCPVRTLDEAIALMKSHPNANATSIFTSSGKAAREFAKHADASMVGVNIGVAAPMAYFPFGGAKDSFFGDLKAHGRDAFEFYTDKKVTISRWF